MKEFTRIETLAGVKRTIFNQYDALVRPLESWLAKQGVRFLKACTVTNLDQLNLTDGDSRIMKVAGGGFD
jgi:oleate hydratase